MDLIKQVFLPHKAETIMSISLSISLPPDKRKWGGTSNGKFTVSNTYRLIIEDSEKGVLGENFDQAMMKLLWKIIWGMRTPNKVRNFIWRACKDILATKTNLRKVDNDLCTSCNKAAETSGHMFWFCEKAKQVWNGSKMEFLFITAEN